ncbi:MAG TPA: DNA repair protein RecO [Agriterribacter sp.]|nr:DNA repair protein RecO [Agriterribacter sp.]
MVHTTKGIVLRTVSYGETSVIVLLYTELFGLQSYIVNGIRSSKKSTMKANLFQPTSILEMEVYHNELKNLQRIKDAKWHYIYQHIFFNIPKNTVALFMTELIQKVILQPEPNPDLYHFIEDSYIQLDRADSKVSANFPLYFALHFTAFFGFSIRDDNDPSKKILDLQEGEFVKNIPHHPYYVEEPSSKTLSHLLKVMHPDELLGVTLNATERRQLLDAMLHFYALHINDFGTMRSLPILKEILS